MLAACLLSAAACCLPAARCSLQRAAEAVAPTPGGHRDTYPASFLVSHCVWPYEAGEVIVQCYNTLLTLATLLDAADGVLLVQNGQLHAAATRLFNIQRPAFGDLNEIAARNLACALLPAVWRPADPSAVAISESARPTQLLGALGRLPIAPLSALHGSYAMLPPDPFPIAQQPSLWWLLLRCSTRTGAAAWP